MNKTNKIRLLVMVLTVIIIALAMTLFPPIRGYNQIKANAIINLPMPAVNTKTSVVNAKKEVSLSIKKIMDDREQKDILIAKLKAENIKLSAEKLQLKEDRDNTIADNKKLKSQVRIVDANIKQYLAGKDKNLDYHYSLVKKDTLGNVELLSNIEYKISPNKKDTLYLPSQDTVKVSHSGILGWLGIGKEVFKPYKKNK